MNIPKLAIFDFDGTIADHSVIAPSVLKAFNHLHNNGCITSISTGRGYLRLKQSLGKQFDNVISEDAIIILEHGTKLVDKKGSIIFGEFLTSEDVEHIVDFLRANIQLFDLVLLNPLDVSQNIQIWCADESYIDATIETRGEDADVFVSSLGQLRAIILSERLTNITFHLKDHVIVENLKLVLTRTDTSIIFQDGYMEFVRNNMNKGLAVLEVAKKLNIEPEDVLIAGNAINDVEMLDLDVGTTILVGPKETRKTILKYLSSPETITTADSPSALAELLLKL